MGLKVFCLASGGGQQAPIFAAAGAEVTLLDLSPGQMAQDRFVAQRDKLAIRIMGGDKAVVWRECQRALRAGGVLMTGFMNPDEFIFDVEPLDNEGVFVVRHPLPYVEHETLNAEALARRVEEKAMFHFSHTMEAQLGGLIATGFVLTGFYEDRRPEESGNPVRHYMPSYFGVEEGKVGACVNAGAVDQA